MDYPKRYLSGLSKEDKKKQIKQLDKSKDDYKKGKFTQRKNYHHSNLRPHLM